MGFVNAGDFVKFINGKIRFEDIKELCGKCVLEESGILKMGELMDKDEYDHLIYCLKILSKKNSRDIISNCLRSIERERGIYYEKVQKHFAVIRYCFSIFQL